MSVVNATEPATSPEKPILPPSAAQKAGRTEAVPAILLGVAVALTALGLYVGTLGHYFVADDFIYLHQLRFNQPAFADSFAYFGRDWGMGAQFYRPLTRVLWSAEYGIFGENATGWHLVSVLLHSASAALVYLLAWRLSRHVLVGLVAGMLFAVHPAHVETVSWVANQSDLLAGLFCLAGTLSYIQSQQPEASRRGSAASYALALIFFCLALLSKESAAGFFLVPLAYDLAFGLFSPNNRHAGPQTWMRVALRQAPFWAALGLYLALRVAVLGGAGGYDPGSPGPAVPLSVFIESYSRWLLMPLSLDKAIVQIALLVVTVGLVANLVIWEGRQAKEQLSRPNVAASASFRLIRAVLFGIAWVMLFLLPTVSTQPSVRFVYLSTAGLAVAGAGLLAPIWVSSGWPIGNPKLSIAMRSREPWAIAGAKVGIIVVLVLVSIAAALGHQVYWANAGNTVRDILGQMRQHRPRLEDYAYVYAAGLPEANEGALIFRTGFPEAVQMLYGNTTVLGIRVPSFPVVEEHLNQAYFVEYTGGKIVPRDDIIEALQERNRNLKADKQTPFVTWTFERDEGWELVTGNGKLATEGGALRAGLPGGGTIRPPQFRLPAPRLAEFEMRVTAMPAQAESTAVQGVVHWLVETPSGPVERASAPLVIQADGENRTYKIKPANMIAFLYNDIVSEVHIEIPPGLAALQIEEARLYQLP